MDVMSGPTWWVQWPAVGWGMGLAFHGMGLVLGALKRAGTE
ncbi:MAG TPA: 2TM domain-containing protein [Cystobacter sp.]